MQVLTINQIDAVAGAYEAKAFGCTASNGGNNANSYIQGGIWAVAGAVTGGLGGGDCGFCSWIRRIIYIYLLM